MIRFSSPRETSTILPAHARPGEIADRNTQSTTRGFCCATYTPDLRPPRGVLVYELPTEADERE